MPARPACPLRAPGRHANVAARRGPKKPGTCPAGENSCFHPNGGSVADGKRALRGSDLPCAGVDAASLPLVTALARSLKPQSRNQASGSTAGIAWRRDPIEHATFWLLVAGLAWV